MNEQLIIKNRILQNIDALRDQKKRLEVTIQKCRYKESVTTRDASTANKASARLEEVEDKLDAALEERMLFEADPKPFLKAFYTEVNEASATYYTQEKEKNRVKGSTSIRDKKKKDKAYKDDRQDRRSYRWDAKKYHIFYQKLLKAQDSLPDYMKENLAEMSSNKAYKWRGVLFFGKQLPSKGDPDVYFDRRRGVLDIHTYAETRDENGALRNTWLYTRQEKIGKNKAKEVEKYEKKRVFGTATPPGAIPKKYSQYSQKSNRNYGNRNYNNRKRGKSGGRSGGGRSGGGRSGGGRSQSKKVSGWQDTRGKK